MGRKLIRSTTCELHSERGAWRTVLDPFCSRNRSTLARSSLVLARSKQVQAHSILVLVLVRSKLAPTRSKLELVGSRQPCGCAAG